MDKHKVFEAVDVTKVRNENKIRVPKMAEIIATTIRNKILNAL